jgi:sugar-specific transcriptional regulator TrmB
MTFKRESKALLQGLIDFGCSDTEALIYLRLLQLGSSTVQELSKVLELKRTTVHSAVEQLLKKGLLFESRRGKRRLILAEEPDVFQTLVEEKAAELQAMQSTMLKLVSQLNAMQRFNSNRPMIHHYEGVTGFKKMLEETLTAKGEVFVFTYVEIFSELLSPEYLENYFARRAQKGIRTRLIFPPVDFAYRVNERALEYKIQVRVLPKEFKWLSGIFSWNDCVSLKSFSDEKLTCTIIENADIARFYQNIIFELCWQQAKKIRS